MLHYSNIYYLFFVNRIDFHQNKAVLQFQSDPNNVIKVFSAIR